VVSQRKLQQTKRDVNGYLWSAYSINRGLALRCNSFSPVVDQPHYSSLLDKVDQVIDPKLTHNVTAVIFNSP
jgi:hypothetical protein